MKIIIQLAFYFLLCNSCLAQIPLKDGTFKINGKNYIVLKRTYLDRTSFAVREIGRFENTNPPQPKDQFAPPVNKKDIHVDDEMIIKIINDVLKNRASELSKNKDRIDLSLRLLQENGTIESVSYYLPGNSIISLDEVAKIDTLIRKNIRATFSGKEHPNFYLINYGMLRVIF